MPDINSLLFKLIDEKGKRHVIDMLNHDTTAIIERWLRDGDIPRAKRWDVLEAMVKEGVLPSWGQA